MAEPGPPGAQLPPPPQSNAGAPGYENGQNGGSGSHMPPPPLHIPPNTNPIPTAITSPMTGNTITSPGSANPFVRRAAPEPNKRALYVGGLDPRVTEDVLRQIFETTGHVQNVKIIPDKNVSRKNPPGALGVCHRLKVADVPLYRIRASTTVSSSMMTLVRPNVPCKP
jgi:nucleolysin TIA-1/TIAR